MRNENTLQYKYTGKSIYLSRKSFAPPGLFCRKGIMQDLGLCPKTGKGVNRWIHRRIGQLARCYKNLEVEDSEANNQIIEQVQRETSHCERDISYDITHSLETTRRHIGDGNMNGVEVVRPKPNVEFNSEAYQSFLAESDGFMEFPKPCIGPLKALVKVFGEGLVTLVLPAAPPSRGVQIKPGAAQT